MMSNYNVTWEQQVQRFMNVFRSETERLHGISWRIKVMVDHARLKSHGRSCKASAVVVDHVRLKESW